MRVLLDMNVFLIIKPVFCTMNYGLLNHSDTLTINLNNIELFLMLVTCILFVTDEVFNKASIKCLDVHFVGKYL